AAALGVTAKFPRIVPESVGEEAKKAMAPFLKALKPGTVEQAYFAKRNDAKAAAADVLSACQAAAEEMSQTAAGFEKSDEPLRVLAVTRKLSVESQCRQIDQTDGLRRDLEVCKKKAKSADCRVACAKAKGRIDEGLLAAAFVPMTEEVGTLCKE